jgi:hypothetical protein|nr:MAG TPA: Major capsid protein [Caudoviricetes sp.]
MKDDELNNIVEDGDGAEGADNGQNTDNHDDDNNGTNASNTDDNKGGNKGGKLFTQKGGKLFTQKEVNRFTAREKEQGRNSVYKALGLDPKDKKTIEAVKSFVESQKTEEQKNAEREAESNTKLLELEQRAMLAEAKAEVMALGVKGQFVDDAVTLALAKLNDDNDLKTVISSFKDKYPIWFKPSEEDKGSVGQRGTGSSVNNSKETNDGKHKTGLGARLATQRRGKHKKSSYWGN